MIKERVSYAFIFTLLSSGLFFLFHFVLAKFLGADVYGEITYNISFINLMTLVIGLSHPSLYMGSRIGGKDAHTFSLFFTLESLLFLLFGVPAFFIIHRFITDVWIVSLILAISYFLVITFAMGLEYNAKNQVSRSILLSNLLPRVTLIVLFTLCIVVGYGTANYYVYAYFVSSFLFFVWVLFQLKPKFYIQKKILHRAWKFYLIGTLGTSFTYIAQILQKEYGDYRQLATLSVVLLFFAGLSLVGTVLVKFLLPRMHAYYRDGNMEKIAVLYSNNTLLMLFFIFPILMFLMFNIAIIATILGEGYENLPWFFYILTVGYVVNIVTGMTGHLLRITENEHYEIYNELGKMFSGFLLIYLLKEYPYGIAIGITVSMVVYNLFKYIEVYMLLKFVPLSWRQLWYIIGMLIVLFIGLSGTQSVETVWIKVLVDMLVVLIVYFGIYRYIVAHQYLLKGYTEV